MLVRLKYVYVELVVVAEAGVRKMERRSQRATKSGGSIANVVYRKRELGLFIGFLYRGLREIVHMGRRTRQVGFAQTTFLAWREVDLCFSREFRESEKVIVLGDRPLGTWYLPPRVIISGQARNGTWPMQCDIQPLSVVSTPCDMSQNMLL